jgi:hypothetical protein
MFSEPVKAKEVRYEQVFAYRLKKNVSGNRGYSDSDIFYGSGTGMVGTTWTWCRFVGSTGGIFG